MIAALASVSTAQNRRPPVPPTPPAAPLPPTPPAPAPRARPDPATSLFDRNLMQLSELEHLRSAGESLRALNLDELRSRAQGMREAPRAWDDAVIASTHELAQRALEASRAPLAQFADGQLSHAYGYSTSLASINPRYQDDPADSLYRRAHALLGDNNDYRAAAQRFKEVQQKYPNSRYISQAMYFQAFSLYRAGSDAELREAQGVLEQFKQKYPNARFTGENNNPADADVLLQRVRLGLASRGDAAARQQLSQAASGANAPCDRENQNVQTTALSALMRIAPAEATPKLEQILAKRDDCSLQLRIFALQILTQRGDEKSVATLLSTAKNDPSPQMRANAIGWAVRFPNDDVFTALETIARSDQSDLVRRTAARSLVGYPSPRARQVVRVFIEDNTLPDNLRQEILNRYNSERGTAEDAAWLRTSFSKVTSPAVKSAIVNAVGQIGGTDSQKWLMDLATSDQETPGIRAAAFSRVAATMSVQDLSRAYDAAGNRPMRRSIVSALNARKEPEALDKLIDIARKTTDFTHKNEVINMLTNRKDNAKVTALLIELIDR
jgi:HEAT repeat protein